MVKELITLCGDNCIECPRYKGKTKEELEKVAELWYNIGWMDKIVSADEIKCTGCSSHKQCTFKLVGCIKEHKISKCNQCTEYPCNKIEDMFKRSKEYKIKCKEVCSDSEYKMVERAFFHKEENMNK